MQNIKTLYALFTCWTQVSHEEYIRANPAAAFLNVDFEGRGFIGDDTGGVYFEFKTIRDGIRQLKSPEPESAR